jgi:predicted neutral ceramidase superfamily lipid hydrolase
MNRQERRVLSAQYPQYWRVTPMFRKEDATLEAGLQTYVIHTKPVDLVIVVTPTNTCTVEFAQKTEQELMAKFQKDVILTTDNVQFLKVEPVDPQELAKLLKGVS